MDMSVEQENKIDLILIAYLLQRELTQDSESQKNQENKVLIQLQVPSKNQQQKDTRHEPMPQKKHTPKIASPAIKKNKSLIKGSARKKTSIKPPPKQIKMSLGSPMAPKFTEKPSGTWDLSKLAPDAWDLTELAPNEWDVTHMASTSYGPPEPVASSSNSSMHEEDYLSIVSDFFNNTPQEKDKGGCNVLDLSMKRPAERKHGN